MRHIYHQKWIFFVIHDPKSSRGSKPWPSCFCPPQLVNDQCQGCPTRFHRAHWPDQSYFTILDRNQHNPVDPIWPWLGSEITELVVYPWIKTRYSSKAILLSVLHTCCNKHLFIGQEDSKRWPWTEKNVQIPHTEKSKSSEVELHGQWWYVFVIRLLSR